MKKFFVTLILLIILGALAFFFGWVQLLVDKGEYGVVHTKTGGWHDSVVVSDEFFWMWERLIPYNFSIEVYSLKNRVVSEKISGSLPSGYDYARYLEFTPDFDFSFDINITYRLNKNQLPSIAKQLPQYGDIDNYYSNLETGMRESLQSTIHGKLTVLLNSPIQESTTILKTAIIDNFSQRFPEIEILTVQATDIKIPDYNLYEQAKRNFQSILDARQKALIEAVATYTQNTYEEEETLSRLKKYGELLTEYPILVEYFSAIKTSNENPLDIESLESFLTGKE